METDRLIRLTAALRADQIVPGLTVEAAIALPDDAPEDRPALIRNRHDACIFRDVRSRRCAIHTALGHDALPLACRQFPRVIVNDPGGISVTLSHYCPTAAALLDARGPLSVVTNATSFPANGEYVGLDAREGLPPLLRPDMAMDWESWWAWERQAVTHFERADTPVDHLLRELGGIVEAVRRWSPSDGGLLSTVGDAFTTPHAWRCPERPTAEALLAAVADAIPAELRPTAPARDIVTSDHVRRRFLAAHAFANWTAHLGLGLRAWLRSIQAADALLNCGLGVRQADLWLRHLADPDAMAKRWSRAEG